MAKTNDTTATANTAKASASARATASRPASKEARLKELQKRFSPEYLATVRAALRRQGQAQQQAAAEKPKQRQSKNTTTTTNATASAPCVTKSGAVSKPKARPTASTAVTAKISRRATTASKPQPSHRRVSSPAAKEQENTQNSEGKGPEEGELAQEQQTLSQPPPSTRAPHPVEVVLQRATGHFCPQTRQEHWYYPQRETWIPQATDTKKGQWWYSTSDSGQAVRYQVLPGQGTHVAEQAWEERRQALMYKVRSNRYRFSQ
ncbi:hypothetical protein TWF696_005432 [Orbilia brochopaga]|uniref:Uncharacterized protein n=1 Tax=Orbilia brochopaga TaxID=3140254 RepID=A0AAV9V2F9_9PEZI